MAEDRLSFLMYLEDKEIMKELSNEQAGILIKNIMSYQSNEELLEMDQVTRLAFILIRQKLDRDRVKYESTCEKRRAAGSKGGKTRAINQANQANATFATNDSSKTKQDQANQADNEYEYDNENDNEYEYDHEYVNDNDHESVKKDAREDHIIPTLHDIELYAAENGLRSVDCQKFYDHYSDCNWMYKGKAIDWMRKLREWDREDAKHHAREPDCGIFSKGLLRLSTI